MTFTKHLRTAFLKRPWLKLVAPDQIRPGPISTAVEVLSELTAISRKWIDQPQLDATNQNLRIDSYYSSLDSH